MMPNSLRTRKKMAYGLARLIELPYDCIRAIIAAADKLPAALSSQYVTTQGRSYKEDSRLGVFLQGVVATIFLPLQWLVGGLYNLFGLRKLSNWLRETADRKILEAVIKDDNEGQKIKKRLLLSFLHKRRNKYNAGRGAFTSFSFSFDEVSRIDKCLNELLALPSQNKNGASSLNPSLLQYLNFRLTRVNDKLKSLQAPTTVAINTRIETPCTMTYHQHPSVLLFKIKEPVKKRKLRLQQNQDSLNAMISSLRSST